LGAGKYAPNDARGFVAFETPYLVLLQDRWSAMVVLHSQSHVPAARGDKGAGRIALILALALPFGLAAPPAAAEFLDAETITNRLSPAQEPRVKSLGPRAKSVAVEPKVDLDVKFEYDSARLTEAAVHQLDALGAALSSERLVPFRFEIAGHTDAHGTAVYNQSLSERRSDAVKNYLVSQFRIEPGRLQTVGWGFRKLQDPQNPWNPDNRRVEVTNLGAK
jgi:outer membrane protein OmpA-like peptidoglycan-associated protein